MKIVSKPITTNFYICDNCNKEHRDKNELSKCVCGKEVCTNCGICIEMYLNVPVRINVPVMIHKNKKYKKLCLTE